MEKKAYRIVVVGPTGSGKSQFCNFVKKDLTNSFYKVDDSLKSCTEEILSSKFERNKTYLELIDTPGSNDSSNNDTLNLKKLVKYLKEKKEIDAIILLLKFGERLNNDTKEYFKTLANIFTPYEFFCNLCVVFSHFPNKPKDKDYLKKEKNKKEINEFLKSVFEINNYKNDMIPDVKVFTLDTEVNEDEEKTQEQKNQEIVDLLIRQIKLNRTAFGPINTENIDITGKNLKIRRDNMEKEIEDLKKELADKEKLEKEIEQLKNQFETIDHSNKKEKEKVVYKLLEKAEINKQYEEKNKKENEKMKKYSEEQKKINEEAKKKGIQIDSLDTTFGILGTIGAIALCLLFKKSIF